MHKRFAAFAILVFALRASAACPLARAVGTGDTLGGLAAFYFGDEHFDSAILMATNARLSEGFPFIGNFADISRAQKVCIPEREEAQRLRSRWDTYERAVHATTLPEPWQAAAKLVTFPPDDAITVATWKRTAQTASLKDSAGAWLTKAPADLWVTVEPHLKDFCSAFAAAHTGDSAQLTLRLEQRLGLPPGSAMNVFVRIRVTRPGPGSIFRPCMLPDTAAANCPVGGPPDSTGADHQNWIYRQYYSSFGQSRFNQFPWTGLGYTFDWALKEHGLSDADFERFGESEFVIPKGAPIEVLGTTPTAEYCAAR